MVPGGWVTDLTSDTSSHSGTVAKVVTKSKSGNPDTAEVIPTETTTPLGKELSVIVVIHRFRKDAEKKDYSVTVVNTNNAEGSGIDYHPIKVDPTDGTILYNLAFEMRGVENDRILNSAFWVILFKSGIYANPKFGAKFIYEKVWATIFFVRGMIFIFICFRANGLFPENVFL